MIKTCSLQKHKKRIERFCEFDANKKVTIRKEMAIQKSNEKIVGIIAKKMKVMSKKYLKLAEPSQFEEISRRFALLTKPFIVESLEKIDQIFQLLKMTVSYATIVYKTLSHMKQVVILLPDIGPPKCILVRERIAELIARAIARTKNRSLKRIKNDSNRSSKTETTTHSGEQKSIHFRKREVSVVEIVQAVEEAVNYSEEGRRRKASVSKSNHEVFDLLKFFGINLDWTCYE